MSDRWYFAKRKDGRLQKYGPTTFEYLRKLAREGKLRPSDQVLKEGTDRWVPAVEVGGLFPVDEPPQLPPLPPLEAESDESEHEEYEPRRQRPAQRLSAPAKVALYVGGGFLLLLFVAALIPPSPGPGGTSGVGSGGAGAYRVEGTYRRKWSGGSGIGVNDYITFAGDGRFQERGFLHAGLGNAITSDRGVWFDANGSGAGTFRLSAQTLDLHYTSYNGGAQNGPISVPFHPTAWDGTGLVTAAVLNGRYAFERVGP